MTANRRLQSIVDNAASGASTALVETSLADGIIEFNESAAEMILFSEMRDYFELVDFNTVPLGGYKQLTLQENSSSYFQMDPIIMRLIPDNHVNLSAVPAGTPIIEYILFNPKDNLAAKTFYLANGQSLVLYKPTIVLSVTTKVYAPVMLYPITMHKISIREVSLGQTQ